jgi:hypothetical protein
MKVKISKSDWENFGRKAGWLNKEASFGNCEKCGGGLQVIGKHLWCTNCQENASDEHLEQWARGQERFSGREEALALVAEFKSVDPHADFRGSGDLSDIDIATMMESNPKFNRFPQKLFPYGPYHSKSQTGNKYHERIMKVFGKYLSIMNGRIIEEEGEYREDLKDDEISERWPKYMEDARHKIEEMNRIRDELAKYIGPPKTEDYPNF